MSNLEQLLTDVRNVVRTYENEGAGLTDPALQKLGFDEKELSDSEKKEFHVHQFDYVKCWIKKERTYEVTILDREWDRSKTFQVLSDRIEITIKVKNLIDNTVQEECFSWDEKTPWERNVPASAGR